MTLHATHHHSSVHHDTRHTLEEQVKAAGLNSRFIDDATEKALVTAAVGAGLDAEYAANVVRSIAMEKGFVVESELEHFAQVVLKHMGAKNKGKIDKVEFEECAAMAGDLAHGVVPEPKLKKKMKTIMIDNGFAAQTGGLFHADWFKAI
jgi:hypothetical protein